VWGRPRAAALLAALLLLAHVALAWGVGTRMLPAGAALGMLTLPLAWQVARGARRHADELPALVPTMGRNVGLCLGTPLLMALGLVIWS
jgi:1,4-dihydroxy-2-naphthoate octaprenyltransferase